MNIAREDHNQPEAHDMSHKKGLDSELAFAEKHHAVSRNRYRSTPLEDYALLSDLQTGPLVSRDGSVDWLCLPRFDSPSVFAALLGTPDDGRWKLLIRNGVVASRSYIPDTFILETVWETPTGKARVLDYLPPSTVQADLIRSVECLEGEVTVSHDLRVRFSYARALPWFRHINLPETGDPALLCVAGPDGLLLAGPLLYDTTEPDEDHEHLEQGTVAPRLVGDFALKAGEKLDWSMTWFPSWQETPVPVKAEEAFEVTKEFWQHWIGNLDVGDTRSELVRRSLLVLRALTHSDTGGIVAAPTASLPEDFGGERNWDYRYTWLRDAALTVEVMVAHGFVEGATNWRDWLLRAGAGDVENLQIMYGLGGERELEELELDHLAGYENSRPVRIGNGAAGQYQADVVGEVMLALAKLRDAGYSEDEFSWGLQKKLLDYTITNIHQKDHGIWEMRGDLHYFTHGRVMMWAAFNEGIRAVEEYGLDGDAEVWRYHRDSLRDELLLRGYNEELGSFTQSYENTHVDASLLQIPHTGFLAADDPRMLGTVAQIEKQLVDSNGLVYRYLTDDGIDGLAGHEYPFLICTFWLIEQYAMSGRIQEAQERLDSVVAYANDLGLLSEEYDPQAQRLAGNFPQAFSHLGLIRAVDAIERYKKGSADQD
ncbi:Glycoside hydrolase 15-related protein [Corynebacterium pseudotuberculosis]|uniref:glycoside hydrolase family 15 protein n=1 Tax=Corynebacterium pseudotuberculosis TaxID=1719 RepID=UPI00065DE22B|nr:glycoside hydrolase family 15 protein [Corynebacterium pseudotuberculosis]AKP09613.1 Glycoside hydrolase 15-related protein [Corynebacterium pseudotuberculosis]